MAAELVDCVKRFTAELSRSLGAFEQHIRGLEVALDTDTLEDVDPRVVGILICGSEQSLLFNLAEGQLPVLRDRVQGLSSTAGIVHWSDRLLLWFPFRSRRRRLLADAATLGEAVTAVADELERLRRLRAGLDQCAEVVVNRVRVELARRAELARQAVQVATATPITINIPTPPGPGPAWWEVAVRVALYGGLFLLTGVPPSNA